MGVLLDSHDMSNKRKMAEWPLCSRARLGWRASWRLAAVLGMLSGCRTSGEGGAVGPPPPDSGRRVYLMRCVPCHGPQGDGRGGRLLAGTPRSFIADEFRSAARPGVLPTDEALHKVLVEGLPGTGMPAFPFLTPAERTHVIGYLRTEFFVRRKRSDAERAGPAATVSPAAQPAVGR